MKQDQQLCSQPITNHTDKVYSQSFNEQLNKLISCSIDSQLLIIVKSKQGKQLSVTQKIKVDQFGLRVCFINDEQFTFQSICEEQMHVYEMDKITKQYKKTKELVHLLIIFIFHNDTQSKNVYW